MAEGPHRYVRLKITRDTLHIDLSTFLDVGSITVLWSQPVASLQILTSEGKWKNVKHIDNAVVRVRIVSPLCRFAQTCCYVGHQCW